MVRSPTRWCAEPKILWNMTIKCDHVIVTRRPDIVLHEKESTIFLHLGIIEYIKRRVKRLVPRSEEGD